MAVGADGIDHARFGAGYRTDAEKNDKYVLADDSIRYDAGSGAGGAVPYRNYEGEWPPFKSAIEKDRQRQEEELEKQWQGSKKPQQDNELDKAERLREGRPLSTNYDMSSSDASTSKMAGNNTLRPDWTCRTITPCSPCLREELKFPYCQPYGNKATIECREVNVAPVPDADRLERLSEAMADKSAGDSKARPAEVIQQKPAAGKQRGRRRAVSLAKRLLAYHRADGSSDASAANVWQRIEDLSNLSPVFMARGDAPLSHESHSDLQRSSMDDHSDLARRQDTFVSSFSFKGYQICGRSRAREARDYAEFVGINLLLSLAALYFLLQRQRNLAQRHQQMVARRIGRR